MIGPVGVLFSSLVACLFIVTTNSRVCEAVLSRWNSGRSENRAAGGSFLKASDGTPYTEIHSIYDVNYLSNTIFTLSIDLQTLLQVKKASLKPEPCGMKMRAFLPICQLMSPKKVDDKHSPPPAIYYRSWEILCQFAILIAGWSVPRALRSLITLLPDPIQGSFDVG